MEQESDRGRAMTQPRSDSGCSPVPLYPLVGRQREIAMTGTRYRSEHMGYGLEWYDGSAFLTLVILGGVEYGWADNIATAKRAIESIVGTAQRPS